ncbi:hypothetical protein IFR05_017407, partial [Cadophora sp. M221]
MPKNKKRALEVSDQQLEPAKRAEIRFDKHDYNFELFLRRYNVPFNLFDPPFYLSIVDELYHFADMAGKRLNIFVHSNKASNKIASAAEHARDAKYDQLSFAYAELCHLLLGTNSSQELVRILNSFQEYTYLFFVRVIKPFLEAKNQKQGKEIDKDCLISINTYFLYSGKYFDFCDFTSEELM